MHLIPSGDYYIWYCDWCDSTNRTIWIRVEEDQIFCSACGKNFPLGSFSNNKTFPEAACA